MKKTFQKILSIFLVLCLFNVQGFASVGMFTDAFMNADDTEFAAFDEAAFYDEFQEVEALENYLTVNNATYAEVEGINDALLTNVSSSSIIPLAPEVAEGPVLGIPSFLWGCALSWVGLLIVYLMAEDTAETKKALWGCILGTLLWGGSSFLFY